MKSDNDRHVRLEKVVEKIRKDDIELMESIRRSGGFVDEGILPEQKTPEESEVISEENSETDKVDTKKSVDDLDEM